MYRSDDGTLTPDNAITRWCLAFEDATLKSGRITPSEEQLKTRLEEAGFVDVQTFILKQPIGPWPKAKYGPQHFPRAFFFPVVTLFQSVHNNTVLIDAYGGVYLGT
jgi:hypothetical protein